MVTHEKRPWHGVLQSLAFCALFFSVGAVPAQEWDLSGDWVIDYDESDRPDDVFDALSERRRGRSGVGVGVGIFGVPVEVARSDGRGQEPAEVVRRDLRQLRPHLVSAVDRLFIEQVQDGMTVGYSNLGRFAFGDGESLTDGDETISAEWRRDCFTIVWQVGDDLRATEQLSLDRQDPSRLRWLLSVELSSARTVQVRRVFDRVPQP